MPAQARRGEGEIALIAFGIGKESSCVYGAATFARDNEGKVFAGVFVPVLKTGAPHHDAIIEQGTLSFAQAVHLFHHVGELGDVESGDCGDLGNLVGFIVMMGLGMVLIPEPKFRIGNTVRGRSDVGADASRIGLEGQYVEVAHDLHVFAAFVTEGNLDLDGWRISSVAPSRATPAFSAASFWRNSSMAAMRRSTERTLSRYSSSLCWIVPGSLRRRSLAPPITRSSICRSRGSVWTMCPDRSDFPKSRLRTLRGLISAGTAWVGERKLQCE